MRARCAASVAIAFLFAAPLALAAQEDEAAEARYAAAMEWINLVMTEGDYEAAADKVNGAVAAQLGAAQLEAAAGQLSGQLGALLSLEPQRQGMEQGFYEVVMTGVFDAGTFDVQVFLADDHTVAGFFVRPVGD
ncbi:MAG: DUF3887 domain-containing protein [Gemmatimonadota bacterium]|nr:DUF3887 domain-containing protein [Gemmatimonadota bacterium]